MFKSLLRSIWGSPLHRGLRVATVAALVIIPLLTVGLCMARDRAIDARFERITKGMSSEQILRIMGPPAINRECTSYPPKSIDCANEFAYSPTMPLVTPFVWIIRFDHQGHAVEKAELNSP
jgi:hypothetical protein